MNFLGFKSSGADPALWMREYVRNDGITKYYDYVCFSTQMIALSVVIKEKHDREIKFENILN